MSNSDYTGQPSQLEQQAQIAASGTPYDPQNSAEMLSEQIRNGAGQPRYMPESHSVDSVALSRAQSHFIGVQTDFLMTGAPLGSPEYVESLRRYSGAQNRLILALQTALRQAGVL